MANTRPFVPAQETRFVDGCTRSANAGDLRTPARRRRRINALDLSVHAASNSPFSYSALCRAAFVTPPRGVYHGHWRGLSRIRLAAFCARNQRLASTPASPIPFALAQSPRANSTHHRPSPFKILSMIPASNASAAEIASPETQRSNALATPHNGASVVFHPTRYQPRFTRLDPLRRGRGGLLCPAMAVPAPPSAVPESMLPVSRWPQSG